MSDKSFIDTNVLIYAHDVDAGDKHVIAVGILKELWSTRLGVLSTQVLQEFYVNVTRKIPSPLPRSIARDIVKDYITWQVEIVDLEQVLLASELEERYQLSFWDALIVAAVRKGGAAKILSEDFNAGQRIDGVSIENSFATTMTS